MSNHRKVEAIFALLDLLPASTSTPTTPKAKAKAPKKAANKAASVPHSKEVYQRWFRDMYLMRKFEERCGQLYIQQKFGGFCHLYIGQEAILAGISRPFAQPIA